MENNIQKQSGMKEQKGEGGLYGPRCSPLFYTALLTPPCRLSWSEMPGASLCRVTLSLSQAGGARTPLWSALATPNKKTTWELPALDLDPGILYAWHVEPLYPATDPNGPKTLEGVRLERYRPGLEARFWLLDADALAHVRYGLGLLDRSPDPEFALLARAIVLSEAGLFQEALRLVQQGTKSARRPGQTLLADTALSVIYRQMERHLATQEGLPDCFGTWVRNREQYHRGRVRAQMISAQAQTLQASGGREAGPKVFAPRKSRQPLNVVSGRTNGNPVSL